MDPIVLKKQGSKGYSIKLLDFQKFWLSLFSLTPSYGVKSSFKIQKQSTSISSKVVQEYCLKILVVSHFSEPSYSPGFVPGDPGALITPEMSPMQPSAPYGSQPPPYPPNLPPQGNDLGRPQFAPPLPPSVKQG